MTATQGDSSRKHRMVWGLVLVVCGMFAFGYALVPLYDVICEITGLNGKTGRVAVDQQNSEDTTIDAQRLVTVEFVASVNSGLPWTLQPGVSSMRVHPGALNDAVFYAENLSRETLIGQAVPSVAPGPAAKYFNKTECFCFTQQTLEGGQERAMPVRFIVDPKLPAHIKSLTLSYTFFRIGEPADRRRESSRVAEGESSQAVL